MAMVLTSESSSTLPSSPTHLIQTSVHQTATWQRVTSPSDAVALQELSQACHTAFSYLLWVAAQEGRQMPIKQKSAAPLLRAFQLFQFFWSVL